VGDYDAAMRKSTILGWALVGALVGVGCGGGSAESTEAQSQSDEHAGGEQAGEHHEGEGEGDEHAGLPPSVEAFHSAMAPVWHSEAGESRASLACENAGTLVERADGITTSAMPEGVDQSGWATATSALVSAAADLNTACEAGGADAEAKLSAVHDAFHAVVDQLRADR
jgi:hypothetical protein